MDSHEESHDELRYPEDARSPDAILEGRDLPKAGITIHKACGGDLWVVVDHDNEKVYRKPNQMAAKALRRELCQKWRKEHGYPVQAYTDLQGEGYDRDSQRATKSAAIRTLANQGLSVKEIAQQLDLRYQHVYQVVSKMRKNDA